MMTMKEAVAYLRSYDIPVDAMTLERWITERKIHAFRLKGDRTQRCIPLESLVPLLLERLREDNLQLRQQYEQLLRKRAELPEEEPPF